jgi:hypothetical protein
MALTTKAGDVFCHADVLVCGTSADDRLREGDWQG